MKENYIMENICEQIATEFSDGQIISHSWLKDKFGIEEKDISDFKSTEEYNKERDKMQFQYLALIEKLRDTLLEDYKMYMRNSRGEGYVIVKPDDQTTIAYKTMVKDISGSIKEAKQIMYNVRDVKAEQKAKDDDLRAKIGIMEQMFNNLK